MHGCRLTIVSTHFTRNQDANQKQLLLHAIILPVFAKLEPTNKTIVLTFTSLTAKLSFLHQADLQPVPGRIAQECDDDEHID